MVACGGVVPQALAVSDPSGETVRTLLKDFYDARTRMSSQQGRPAQAQHEWSIVCQEFHASCCRPSLLPALIAAGSGNSPDPQHRAGADSGLLAACRSWESSDLTHRSPFKWSPR